MLKILLFSSILFLLFYFCHAEALNVTIPDPNLEAALRSALNKPTGNLTDSDLGSLSVFTANNKGIVNLTGLEYCVNLTRLEVNQNMIKNITPLAGLTKLTALSAYANQITDIGHLANLTKLISLNLENNQISDVTPLANCTRLEWLVLHHNKIANISPLSGLAVLRELHIADNQINNISSLASLTNLTSLNLEANQISDIGPLANCINLKWLVLHHNKIIDVSPLAGLVNLRELHIAVNQISSISPLVSLTNLTSLNLDANQISDIGPLANCINLKYLVLNNNKIINISPLTGLSNLTTLHIYNNQVSDISSLANLTKLTYLSLGINHISNINILQVLTNLTWLYLDGNKIKDIGPLKNLTNMKEIGFWDNQINDISSLGNLTGLTTLNAGANQISDISSLKNLTGLVYLRLNSNRIKDIGSLSGLINLRELYLDDNLIVDLQPLIDNPGLVTGDVVEVRNNPLSYASRSVYIPSLQARGVNVLFSPAPPVAPGAITNLSASTGNNPNEVKLTWTASGDDGNEGKANAYIVKYNLVPITELNWDKSYDVSGEPIPKPAGSSETMNITLSSSGVVYYFAIKSQDDDNPQNTSAVSNSPCLRLPMKLEAGWNLVSFIQAKPMATSDAVSSILDYVSSVWMYDSSKWYQYIKGIADPFISNLVQMKPGFGYWLNVTSDCIWDFGGIASLSPSLNYMPKPPFLLYGTIYGDIEDAKELNVSFKVENMEIGSYIFRSNPNYNNYYMLYIPVDNAFYEGDAGQLYVDGVLVDREMINLGEMGTALRHDIWYMRTPDTTNLLQNYPNPFNPETWVPYQLKKSADVVIKIYSSTGNLVRTLELGYKPAGFYFSKSKAAYWDGRNAEGEKASSGVYFYTIKSGDFTATKKMIMTN